MSMELSSKNTAVGCLFLHQGIFLTQGLNPDLLHLLNQKPPYPVESQVNNVSLFFSMPLPGRSNSIYMYLFLVLYLCLSYDSWASLIAQLVKNSPAMQETPVWFLGWKICWRRDRLLTPVFLGFLGGSTGKESTCNAGDLGLIPGSGRSPGEEKGYPLQYSGLENSTDRTVHGAAKSQTQLSDFHFTSLRQLLHFRY